MGAMTYPFQYTTQLDLRDDSPLSKSLLGMKSLHREI
jgi:hypothetical protein